MARGADTEAGQAVLRKRAGRRRGIKATAEKFVENIRGRFDWRRKAQSLAEEIAGDEPLETLKLDESGVFRIGDSVLTLIPPKAHYNRLYLQEQIDLADHLNQSGIPAAKPLTPQALERDGLLMARWSFVKTSEEPADRQKRSRQMGETLRAIHNYGETFTGELPDWNTATRPAGAIAVNLSTEDQKLLEQIEEDVLREISGLEQKQILLHGDFHPGNAIFADDGAAVIDLDRICLGSREYDLAQPLFFARFMNALDEEEFIKGYGEKLDVHPAWIRLRALHSTLWLASIPGQEEAAEEHMKYWRSGSHEPADWKHLLIRAASVEK